MKTQLISFACGLVFALGLGLSGMTQPEKIIGFLDVFGTWDPTLMFVMVGGIMVNVIFFPRIFKRGAPRMGPAFDFRQKQDITVPLIGGAALFGAGWGLVGFCPGPALVSIPTGLGPVLAFVGAMAGGMLLHDGARRVLRKTAKPPLARN